MRKSSSKDSVLGLHGSEPGVVGGHPGVDRGEGDAAAVRQTPGHHADDHYLAAALLDEGAAAVTLSK